MFPGLFADDINEPRKKFRHFITFFILSIRVKSDRKILCNKSEIKFKEKNEIPKYYNNSYYNLNNTIKKIE